MKLLVPYVGELQAVDTRLIRLAEFLGMLCEGLLLARGVVQHAQYLERAIGDQRSCFVVNPSVMKEWLGGDGLGPDLVSFLVSRFPYILVHGLSPDAASASIVGALSRGRLQSVQAVDDRNPVYEVARNFKDFCGAFSGLSFGPANPVNDHVFSIGSENNPNLRTMISISGRPFLTVVRLEGTEILFLASEDVVELNAEADDEAVIEYFSRLVPHTMALRHVGGNECWHPFEQHACVVIDDVLLQENYGFLNFESLLRLAQQYNFHASIAFIPHNFCRSSSRIVQMFHENPTRLSLCFHGNDHTRAEFASSDKAILDTILTVAEHRMDSHFASTGIPCDKVMVFPQGSFSVEAMEVLESHNFHAAVNTHVHPARQPSRLTIAELAQPAVLRYGDFPLFLRRRLRDLQAPKTAFNLFFGRPILIGAHHFAFEHPESLAEIAMNINSVAPEIHWCGLASTVSNSFLERRAPDGTHHIRAYSGTVRISNNTGSIGLFSIEWRAARSLLKKRSATSIRSV